jgi:hypothetical protein
MTNPPTNYPSSAPSYDLRYQEHITFANYTREKAAYLATQNSFTFGSYYFKGLTADGQCTPWKSYVTNTLQLPFDYTVFSQLALSVASYDFSTRTFNRREAVCSDRKVIKGVVSSLRSLGTYAADCAFNQWRVFPCNGQPVVCVNCKLSCSKSEVCPARALGVNPCMDCESHVAAATLLNAQYTVIPLYPQLASPSSLMISEVTRTSLRVTVNVTAAGRMYCAAFAQTVALSTVLTIRSKNTFVDVKAAVFNNLTISGLNPDSPYFVYCVTQDSASHVMPLSTVISQRAAVQTLPGRNIVVVKSYPNIVQYTTSNIRPESVFVVGLDSVPLGPTAITTALSLVNCKDSSVVTASPTDTTVNPSKLWFYPNSTTLTGTFVVRGPTAGCYKIALRSSGATVYNGTSLSFIIQSNRVPPNLPVLNSVAFSAAANSLLFVFDADTDRGAARISKYDATFNCSVAVSFPGSQMATCRWPTNNTLEASFGRRASVLPVVGSSAQLLGDLVRANCVAYTVCQNYVYMPSVTRTITAGASPLQPAAILSGPAYVAACDDIRLDPTLSRGFGGRPWKSVVWKVTGNFLTEKVGDVETYLNANYKDTSFKIVVVPNALLTRSTPYVDAVYTFTMEVTNFLQQLSSSSVTVKVNQDGVDIVPSVVLTGTKDVVYRWQAISSFGLVTWPSCASNKTKALPITYDWKLFRGEAFVASAVSTSLDKRYFKLPAYTLEASSTYTVSLTASVKASNKVLSSTASGALQVGQSAVTAVIGGASVRSAGVLDSVVLDASLSADLDYPTAPVTFLWSCLTYLPDYAKPCPGFQASTQSVQTIRPNTLPAGQTYNITVTASNAAQLSSSASVLLTLSSAALPLVDLSAVLAKYNPEDKVILTASATASMGQATARWKSTSVDLTAADVALTPLTKTLTQGVRTQFQLSIAPNKLTAGLSYTFELSAAYDNIFPVSTASSFVTVLMNAPPSGGVLVVAPTVGVALVDDFTLTTSLWTDDAADLPLKYVISTYALRATELNVVKALDEIPYVTTKLGQGLSSMLFAVTCVAAASDSYGSSANATTAVKVTASQFKTAQLIISAAATLNAALENGNPSAVIQAVGAVVASANTVDCSGASATYCAGLRREPCAFTTNTCGGCLAGYIGQSGDSNLVCRKPNSVVPVGGPCVANTTCLSGHCAAGVCVDVLKSCSSKCGTDKGTCVYYDQNDAVIDKCYMTDPLCRAACVCNVNRAGKSCQLTAFEGKQMAVLRESLCAGLYRTLHLQDVTPDVVRNRALTIRDVMVDVNQISTGALYNCTAALLATVNDFPEYACKGGTFVLVSSALSNIVEKGSSLPTDLLDGVTAAMTALTAGCQTDLGVGEAPLTVTTGNMKLVTQLVDKDALMGASISAPRSDFDAFNNVPGPTIAIDNFSLSSSDSLGITIIQFTNNPKKVPTNSSKISVKGTKYSASPSDSNRLAGLRHGRALTAASTHGVGITLVLQNNAPIHYSDVQESIVTVRCFEYKPAEYYRNITCPSGKVLNLTCPAYAKGVYNITCPAEKDTPQCTTFDGERYSANPHCRVVAYTPYNTSCYCVDDTNTGRRRLAGDSGVVEYSSTLVVVATHVGTTFVSAPSLRDVQKNKAILGVLSAFIGLFFVGIIGFAWWDRKDDQEERKVREKKHNTKRRWKTRTVYQFFDSIFPNALRADTWMTLYWNQLLSEHFLIRLFTSTDENRLARTTKWAIAMGKVVAYLFVSSVMAGLLYPDDGYCETFTTEDSCVAAKTAGGFFDACKWRADNESCEFQPPNTDFLTSTILTLVASMLAVPFDKTIEYNIMLVAQFLHYRGLQKRTLPVDGPQEGDSALLKRFDEFALAQTHRSTLFRAARLEKARLVMDFTLPEEEARLVAMQADSLSMKGHDTKLLTNLMDQVSFKRLRYNVNLHSVQSIKKAVVSARMKAATIRREMESMSTAEEQEEFLMRQFIVDAFTAHQRQVVAKYFLKEFSLKRTAWVKAQEYLALVVLPILVLVLIYYVYVFNLSIGARATSMWLIVTFYGLGQDIVLLQPMKVYINTIAVNGSVSSEVRDLCETLSRRARLYLMRTHGMMRDADALVQHFNPACRAARMFPHLPIARLLMSLNDFDIPLRSLPSGYSLPWVYFTAGLLLLTFLPEILQESALDISSGAIIDFSLVGVYSFAQVSPVATAVLVIAFVGTIVVREVWASRGRRSARVAVHIKANDTMFDEMDAELEQDLFTKEEGDTGTLDSGRVSKTSKAMAKVREQKPRPLRELTAVLAVSANAHYESEIYPASDLIKADDLEAERVQDYHSVWGAHKATVLQDNVTYLGSQRDNSVYGDASTIASFSSFKPTSAAALWQQSSQQTPQGAAAFLPVQEFEYLEDVHDHTDDSSLPSVRFRAPLSPYASSQMAPPRSANAAPRVPSPPRESPASRMLNELSSAPLPKVSGPPLAFSNARVFGTPIGSRVRTQSEGTPGGASLPFPYVANEIIYSREDGDNHSVSSIGSERTNSANNRARPLPFSPGGVSLFTGQAQSLQGSVRSEMSASTPGLPRVVSEVPGAMAPLYRRSELIAPAGPDSPPGPMHSGGSVATVSSAASKVDRMLHGRARRKKLEPLSRGPSPNRVSSPPQLDQQFGQVIDDEFSYDTFSVNTSADVSATPQSMLSDQSMRQRSSRARRRAQASLQKVKAARVLGTHHHTEGLGPGGHASVLREQSVTLAEGRSPFDAGNVMPIPGAFRDELDSVPSLGSQFLPSERFGVGAVTSLVGLPGPPVVPQSPGGVNLHGPGPPATVGSPGRYSSEPVAGKETFFPMYQY